MVVLEPKIMPFCRCGCGKRLIWKPWMKYQRIPEYFKGHYNKNKTWSPETMLKQINSHKGKMMGKDNPFYGKKHTRDAKRRMSIGMNGRKAPKSAFKKGSIPWNKGLTIEDERVKKVGLMISKNHWARKDKREEIIKKINTKERSEKVSKTLMGHKHSEETLKKMSGENSSNWLGGKSFEPYTFDFNKRFKDAIKKRDSYSCLLCGLSDFDSIDLYKICLHIHHIDYDKTNSFPQNCCSLCVRCHAITNKDRKIWTIHLQAMLNKLYGYKYTQNQKIILEYL